MSKELKTALDAIAALPATPPAAPGRPALTDALTEIAAYPVTFAENADAWHLRELAVAALSTARHSQPQPVNRADGVPSGWTLSTHESDGRAWLTVRTPHGAECSLSAAATIDEGLGKIIAAQVLDELGKALKKDRADGDAVPVAIYQLQQVNGAWQDVTQGFYNGVGRNFRRIVYAAPPASADVVSVATDRRYCICQEDLGNPGGSCVFVDGKMPCVAAPHASTDAVPVAYMWPGQIDSALAFTWTLSEFSTVPVYLAAPLASTDAVPVASALTVWYGSMPESNGKSNWTAILHRGDLSGGHTIDRSEYPDRVRYEADRVKWLIGEIDKEPWILDYDADKRSDYAALPARTSADALTFGMDRSAFHDKAWSLYQSKTLDSTLLPKLSIHAIRTLWNALYDSIPVHSDMRDAYVGAREDLSIWKRRALAAEALNREQAEEFLVKYHEAVWNAAVDGGVAYDEAGRDLAKNFLSRLDGASHNSASLQRYVVFYTSDGKGPRVQAEPHASGEWVKYTDLAAPIAANAQAPVAPTDIDIENVYESMSRTTFNFDETVLKFARALLAAPIASALPAPPSYPSQATRAAMREAIKSGANVDVIHAIATGQIDTAPALPPAQPGEPS